VATWALASAFGRFNYSFKDRYLLEASYRYDGSSRLVPTNRWRFFPSFSAGWRVSEERFMKNIGAISNLKLRGSWGKLG
ncbi:TonB-dependent receptor, partial [Phocaeicola coprophilus]|nr:TonB-dependent receptor [Phocaeicola coprophilus]